MTPEVPLVTCDVLILAVSLRVVSDDSSLVTRAEGLSMDSIVFDPSRKVRCPIIEKKVSETITKPFGTRFANFSAKSCTIAEPRFFCQIMPESTQQMHANVRLRPS